MHESEWQTRKQRIDTRLRACNPPWQIIPWNEGLDTAALTYHALTEFPTGIVVPASRLNPSPIKKTQAHMDKLTPSLLARAFRGQLIPQDPKDEPAEKLLNHLRKNEKGPCDERITTT